MIAAIWGVFIWKEFRSAKKSVYGLVQRYLTFGHSRLFYSAICNHSVPAFVKNAANSLYQVNLESRGLKLHKILDILS